MIPREPPEQGSEKLALVKADTAQLRQDLEDLGLRRGMTVLVHCSLRRVGWLEGGADTLRDLILELVGESEGTLVVPTQTPSKSVTAREFLVAASRLDEFGREAFMAELPGFRRETSPSEGMGALAEAVRVHPQAFRSAHPLTSFAAVGRHAAELCASHPLHCLLGKESPLGLLYELSASVLLLGVGFDKCTAFHLGEDEAFNLEREYRCKIGDTWVDFRDQPHMDADFAKLGERFLADRGEVVSGRKVGEADALLFPIGVAVDYARQELPDMR